MLLLPCVTHFFRDSIQLLIHWYSSLFTIVNYSLNLQSYSNYSICARVVSFIHFQFYFIDRTAVAHGGATSTFGWTIHPKRKESKGQSRKDRILFFHSFNTTMNTWHNAVLAGTPLLWPSSCKQAAQPSSELVEWPSLGYWLSIVSRTVLKKKREKKVSDVMMTKNSFCSHVSSMQSLTLKEVIHFVRRLMDSTYLHTPWTTAWNCVVEKYS